MKHILIILRNYIIVLKPVISNLEILIEQNYSNI